MVAIPKSAKMPAIVSIINMIDKLKGTILAIKVSEKCSFNQLMFPFQSKTLSTPDCKNVIAKNNSKMISVILFNKLATF